MSLPVVSIVGRPNVGKSSLFNRLVKRRLAVVDDTPGVTRDRNFSVCDWNNRAFYLVDTGGMVPGTDDMMETLILEQARFATSEADVIVFLTDCKTGITDLDSRIAGELHRASKPVIVGVNKVDNEKLDLDSGEFYGLGFDLLYTVSAANGRGVGDLLDEIVKRLPSDKSDEDAETAIRVAVVGRPNVGKSSFVNQLLGENRHIVSEVPGTTRDSIDSPLEIEGRQYILVDTAGLRKRSKVKESIEYYTTLRTVRAIERCEVAIIILDANEGLNFQELKIIEEVGQARRGMVLAVNKWDAFDKDEKSTAIYVRQIQEAMPTYSYIPVIFISALKGQRVVKTLNLVDLVYGQFIKRVETAELNNFLEAAVARQTPPAVKGKWIKFYYITQAETAPPTFVVFTNFPLLVAESYKRYLENRFREAFGFSGIPLKFKFKKRGQ